MRERQPTLLFGANIDPSPENFDKALQIASLADQGGLDLAMVQDHPYNPDFFDTWTLLTFLAARTERIHLGTNVANLPLRPPAMLAKAAASLDQMSGGRVELGLGAGSRYDAIHGMGGPRRTPGEAYAAFAEALAVIRRFWQAGEPATFAGEHYSLEDAETGPPPAHDIRLWVGAYGPKMLRLAGRAADGLLMTSIYLPPEKAGERLSWVTEAAREAGRDPAQIRKGYNVLGVLEAPGLESPGFRSSRPGLVIGDAQTWVDWIVDVHERVGFDTFICWPVRGDETGQIEVFLRDVVPAVRDRLAS